MPTPKRILIIEDSASLRNLMRMQLQTQGYEVDTAETGQIGLNRIGTWDPELLLVDMRLPDMDGAYITEQVTKNHPKVSIVIISAQPAAQHEAGMLKLGAKRYLQKPIPMNILLEVTSQYTTKAVQALSSEGPEILPSSAHQPYEVHVKRCYVCGSAGVHVFRPKPNSYDEDWPTGLFPVYSPLGDFEHWDFLKTRIAVCPSCMFASMNASDFAHRGESLNFPYKIDAKKVLTLGISARRRLIGADVSARADQRFDSPYRDRETVLQSLRLAEKCANGLVLGDKLDAYAEIGFYHLMQGVVDRQNLEEQMRKALNAFRDQLKVHGVGRLTKVRSFYFAITLHLALSESSKANELKEELERFYFVNPPDEASADERRWNQRLFHVWQHGVDIEARREI